jgi:ribosomal protein S18 acetylase RimI-like enzyme
MTERRPIAERAQAPDRPPLPSAAHGLTWVPGGDVPVAVLGPLLRRVEEADGSPFRTSDAELAEHLAAPWHDPAVDDLVGLDGDGAPRAFALVDRAPGDVTVTRAFLWAGVDPQWRGRGIGRQVLAWALGRARQVLVESGTAGPARIVEFVDDSATATVALLRRAGFTAARFDAHLRRAFDGELPPAVVPAGLRLETWTPERDEQARLAHNEAFADHRGSEPRTPEQWAAGRGTFVPGWSAVVVDERTDEVVGYQLSHRYEEDWALTGVPFGYTAMLGVRRRWRHRGVARALLLDAMARYRADGMAAAELGVDTENPSGAFGLYEGLGYVRTSSSTMWVLEV